MYSNSTSLSGSPKSPRTLLCMKGVMHGVKAIGSEIPSYSKCYKVFDHADVTCGTYASEGPKS